MRGCGDFEGWDAAKCCKNCHKNQSFYKFRSANGDGWVVCCSAAQSVLNKFHSDIVVIVDPDGQVSGVD